MVWLASSVAQFTLFAVDRSLIARQLIATSVGGFVAIIVMLAIQLRHEEVHLQGTLDRVAIVAELNHHVRNAVFPMHIAVETLGDADAKKIANDAVERINIALKDATADALARRADYSSSNGAGEARA
jgi:hypothetical protein